MKNLTGVHERCVVKSIVAQDSGVLTRLTGLETSPGCGLKEYSSSFVPAN